MNKKTQTVYSDSSIIMKVIKMVSEDDLKNPQTLSTISPCCISQHWGSDSCHYYVSASPTPLSMVPLYFVVQELFSQPCSSGGIALYIGIHLVCLWEEKSSESSYTAILDPSPISFLM